ncbi:MAG: class I SAM-dependent methyltransferase [Actinomycetota bacterium]
MSSARRAALPASRSIAFDRAAEDYDKTRSLPPGAMRRVQALLVAELRRRQPCVEIGVGTGRLALPLVRAGIRMAGVDLSRPMLMKLRENAGGRAPFPLAMADAVALPFRRSSFGAGLASHVLHLIPAWRDALAELARVLRPGGVVLVEPGGWGSGWWKEVQEAFCRQAGISSPFVGTNDPDEVDLAMRSLGARPRRLPALAGSRTTTIDERLALLEKGVFSFTWSLDERARKRAVERVKHWAEERFGSLARPRRTRWTISWLAYDLR